MQYTQKNVGQIFVCKNKDDQFSYFGIDTSIMGRGQKPCEYDPISKIIENDGSVLIYISKQKILNGEYLRKFRRYINLCKNIDDPRIELYVEQLKEYTGGDTKINKDYYSSMIAHLRKGIVIHHGSLPLQIRIIVEQFTRDRFCRICFATSTLEQGINMPFDMVYLDRLEGSKPLSVKNLIGRAGRSTQELIFDYGIVGINNSCNISKFRNIINSSEVLDEVSGLEKPDLHDSDYEGFKEAILNDTFSDEYNLTNKEIEIISDEDMDDIIASILNSMFDGMAIIKLETIENDRYDRLDLYNGFNSLFSKYLTRNLTDAEANVLNTAVKIIIWKIYGKTFKKICWYRYAYASNTRARRVDKNVLAKFITGYADIPNKSLSVFGLFPLGTKAKDVDYDTIMYDTYDYIDKLIGFKLCDVFYAAFYKYYEETGDTRSLRLAKYIKYGTDNDRHIWMLRYGLDFEDIDLFDPHIDTITSEQITFKNSIFDLSKDELNPVYRFLQ